MSALDGFAVVIGFHLAAIALIYLLTYWNRPYYEPEPEPVEQGTYEDEFEQIATEIAFGLSGLWILTRFCRRRRPPPDDGILTVHIGERCRYYIQT